MTANDDPRDDHDERVGDWYADHRTAGSTIYAMWSRAGCTPRRIDTAVPILWLDGVLNGRDSQTKARAACSPAQTRQRSSLCINQSACATRPAEVERWRLNDIHHHCIDGASFCASARNAVAPRPPARTHVPGRGQRNVRSHSNYDRRQAWH